MLVGITLNRITWEVKQLIAEIEKIGLKKVGNIWVTFVDLIYI